MASSFAIDVSLSHGLDSSVFSSASRRVTLWTDFAIDLHKNLGIDPALILTIIEKQSLSHYHFKEFIQFEVYRYAIKSLQLQRYMFNTDLDLSDVCSCYGILALNFVRVFALGFRGKPWELLSPSISQEYVVQYIQRLSDIHKGDLLKMMVNWKYLGNIYKVAKSFNFEKREQVLSEAYTKWRWWINEKVLINA